MSRENGGRSSFGRRLALAWALGDANILISQQITGDSRVLMHRALTDLFGASAVGEIAACPVADQATGEVVWFPQNALLDDQDGLDTIPAAITKIQAAWR